MSGLPTPAVASQAPANNLGIAGFVISLVGLFTGGLLCPIGLIISIIALGRQPKGFAVAGVILGALGTCGGLIMLLVFGATIMALLGIAVVIALSHTDAIELTADMVVLSAEITKYQADNRYLPASLGDLDVDLSTLNDPWGNPYVYLLTKDGDGFDLVSHGADGIADTEDDIALSRLGDAWGFDGDVNISATSTGENGRVKIQIGDRTIDIVGTEEGGTVDLDLGDKVLRIQGGEGGGTVEVVPDEPETPPEAPAPPPPPAAPDSP